MMRVPAEILQKILSHLQDDGHDEKSSQTEVLLSSYATVSRQWQTICESLIWKQVALHYAEVDYLDECTSGTPWRLMRRTFIRHIDACAWSPWGRDSSCLETPPPVDFEDVADRLLNLSDKEFQTKIVSLLELLSSWTLKATSQHSTTVTTAASTPMNGSIILQLRISGQQLLRLFLSDDMLRPDADSLTVTSREGFKYSNMPYMARFPDNKAPVIPDVPVVGAVVFAPHGGDEIWIDSQCELLSFFPSLSYAQLALRVGNGLLVPSKFILEQRQALIDQLPKLPPSLQTLRLIYPDELPPNYRRNYFSLLSPVTGMDELLLGLHSLSLRLREIHLENIRISEELFRGSAGRVPDEHIQWPSMEVFEVSGIPPISVTGKWILLKDEREVPEYALVTDEEVNWNYRRNYDGPFSYGDRGQMDLEWLDSIYSAAGHAAQQMPRLRKLRLAFRPEDSLCDPVEVLEFSSSHVSHGYQLQIRTGWKYRPSDKVWAAWGIPHVDLVKAAADRTEWLATW